MIFQNKLPSFFKLYSTFREWGYNYWSTKAIRKTATIYKDKRDWVLITE